MKSEKPKRAGRKIGYRAPRKRKTTTITIWPECWDELDKIGPSRGKAVEKLLRDHLKKQGIK